MAVARMLKDRRYGIKIDGIMIVWIRARINEVAVVKRGPVPRSTDGGDCGDGACENTGCNIIKITI